jgi:hypothetical protein
MTLRAPAVLLLKMLLSAGLLALVLSKVQIGEISRLLANAKPQFVLLWYATVPVTNLLIAWRWSRLAPRLGFSTAHKYTWIGLFYSQILPGSLAGDAAKGVSLALKSPVTRPDLVSSIVAEKVIGLLALLVVFDAACAVLYFTVSDVHGIRPLFTLATVSTLTAVAGCLLFVALARWDLLSRFRVLATLRAAMDRYSSRPALVAEVFTLSLIIHLVYIVGTAFSFAALGIAAGPSFAAIVYPVLAIVLLIPVSISGIGLRDTALVTLFAIYGLPTASGAALAWLNLLAAVPNVAIGGAVQLWELNRNRS